MFNWYQYNALESKWRSIRNRRREGHKGSGAFDMGFPINPKMCEGRSREVRYGSGTLMEEYVYDEGVLNSVSETIGSPRSEKYLCEEHQELLCPDPLPDGRGSQRHCEGVMSLWPAIANAIDHAIECELKRCPLKESGLESLQEKNRREDKDLIIELTQHWKISPGPLAKRGHSSI